MKVEKKIDLVLTIDYELYGDGSGDVFETMIYPTEKFLSICETNGIASTIFFEILEYLKLKKEWENGNKMGYLHDPSEAIKNQIIKAFNLGHDIQLHLHPHWINGKFENNQWNLDDRYWKVSNVPLEANDDFPIGLDDLIKLGKDSIEDMLKPIDATYSCNIFRAGGFSITPSEQVVGALKRQGFVADSSVISGAFLDTYHCSYDFTEASREDFYWRVKNKVEVKNEENEDFLEIPIFASPMRRFQKYDKQRIKIAFNNKGTNVKKIKGKMQNQNSMLNKIGFFLEKEFVTWDFCLFSYSKMKNYLNLARKKALSGKSNFQPFVLIGHSKEFTHEKPFSKFLRNHSYTINFMTLKACVERIDSMKNAKQPV